MVANLRLILLGCVLAVFSLSATAETRREKQLGLLLEYLASNTEIIEGVGLKQLRIGDPMSKAARTYPKAKIAREFVSDRIVAEISLDNDTQLRIIGDSRVRKMSFRGDSLSQVKTRLGAAFGMPSYQIISIYGTGVPGGDGKRLDYPRRGIRFYFDKGLTSIIEVFPPVR